MIQRLCWLLLCLGVHSLLWGQIHHWEALVKEDNQWHYIIPEEEPTTDWKSREVAPTGWLVGPGGFGYGDNDDNTILPAALSCYQRINFSINNKQKIRQALLQFDYDDGIVIYLNGMELLRRNMPEGSTPRYNQGALDKREAEVYQGGEREQIFIAGKQLQDMLREGENVLAVQVHNDVVGSSDMTARVSLQAGFLRPGRQYQQLPNWFRAPGFTHTNLPMVFVTTNGAIPDEPKINGHLGIINNEGEANYFGDSYNAYDGVLGIEIRGSTSAQFFDKKSYGLETRDAAGENNNVELFGMPAENDWVLHGPYSDKSLLRNVLMYEIGRRMGHWAPRTQLCELWINDDYKGVYVWQEKIKRDQGRVNIAKMDEEDITGDAVTGGYIIKLDKTTGNSAIGWVSPYESLRGSPVQSNYLYHYPKPGDVVPEQADYIREYVTAFEDAIMGDDLLDSVRGYRQYIDVPSFIDYILASEMGRNIDSYRLSTYLYKKRDSAGGKLYAGPLWDYNLAFGNVNYCDAQISNGWQLDFNFVCPNDAWLNPPWWARLVTQDPEFANEMNCRWQELRAGPLHTDSLLAFINEQVGQLEEAQERNFDRWPILSEFVWPNNFIGNTYEAEVDYLTRWLTGRLQWMDIAMFGNCGGGSTKDVPLNVYPNPAGDWVILQLQEVPQNMTFRLYNGLGQIVLQLPLTEKLTRLEELGLPGGVYYYTIHQGDERRYEGKLVVR